MRNHFPNGVSLGVPITLQASTHAQQKTDNMRGTQWHLWGPLSFKVWIAGFFLFVFFFSLQFLCMYIMAYSFVFSEIPVCESMCLCACKCITCFFLGSFSSVCLFHSIVICLFLFYLILSLFWRYLFILKR